MSCRQAHLRLPVAARTQGSQSVKVAFIEYLGKTHHHATAFTLFVSQQCPTRPPLIRYICACLPSCLPSCLHTCLPSVVRGGAVGGLETAETCRRSDRRSDRRSSRRSDRRTGHTSRTTTTATSAIVVTCIVIPATSTETGSGAGSPQVGSTLIAWWAMGTGWAGWG